MLRTGLVHPHLHHRVGALVFERVLSRRVMERRPVGRCASVHAQRQNWLTVDARAQPVYFWVAGMAAVGMPAFAQATVSAPEALVMHDPTGKYTIKHQGSFAVVEVRHAHVNGGRSKQEASHYPSRAQQHQPLGEST
jgi:hypothetical protein